MAKQAGKVKRGEWSLNLHYYTYKGQERVSWRVVDGNGKTIARRAGFPTEAAAVNNLTKLRQALNGWARR